MMVKAITIFQPWASLIMVGAKPWEFRKWSYIGRSGVTPGDPIGIHAAKRPIRIDEVDDLRRRLGDPCCTTGLIAEKARELLDRVASAPKCRGVLEMGALLGTVRIGEPVLTSKLFPAWKTIADSDRLEHCKWAWPMTNPRSFVPKPLAGAQGFFWASVNEAAL